MTEILLFNQYFTPGEESSGFIAASLPINLLYLITYLKENDLDCKIYELGIFDSSKTILEKGRIRCGISDTEIVNIIEKEKPRIIGLSCMYSIHFKDVVSIARLIKRINLEIKVVLGGNHATIFYNSILKEKSFDFVVRGEGEITFCELCKRLLSDKSNFKDIAGLSFRNVNGEIMTTSNRELISDLDDLPMPEYSLLDIDKYARPINRSPYIIRYPYIGIVTSRGCPGKCVFCTIKAVWGRTWRARSAKKTVDEIELLNTKYGIKEISFLDDSASIDKKRWNDICEEISNRSLNIRWATPNGIAYWTLDKPLLRKMKDAGCYRVTFGIESGNKETREFIGKTYPLSQAKELIRYANRIGMWTICTNIIGFPYETEEAINDTVNFAKYSGTDFATFYLLAPHLTSDVYSYFEKEGLLDIRSVFDNGEFNEDRYESMYRVLNDGGFPTKYFTAEEIKKLQFKAYRNFIIYRALTYLYPLRLLRKIHSPEDLKYTLKLFVNGFKILIKSFFKKTTRSLLYNI